MFTRSIQDPTVARNRAWRAPFSCLAAIMLVACSSTDITTDDDVKWKAAKLPKPDQLIVFDFAASPDEVKLAHGLLADVKKLVDKEPRTEQEKAIGHSVADALSEKLVEELRDKGLPAVRAAHVVEPGIRPLQVKGQLLSIDEGNPTARVVIGLGAGRSSVEARVQLYESLHGRVDLLETMKADTRSGRMPGMAEMIGVGGLAGHIVSSTILSGVFSGTREAVADNVDALAGTMAKKIAAKIEEYYRERGWL
jgi:Domain of unknown function (DUF4410)